MFFSYRFLRLILLSIKVVALATLTEIKYKISILHNCKNKLFTKMREKEILDGLSENIITDYEFICGRNFKIV